MTARFSHESDTIDWINTTGALVEAGSIVELGGGIIGIPRNPIPNNTLGHLCIGGVFVIDKDDASESAAYGAFVTINSEGTVSLNRSGLHTLVEDNVTGSKTARVRLGNPIRPSSANDSVRGAVVVTLPGGEKIVRTPTADTDASRGAQLAAALLNNEAGSIIDLADGFTYQLLEPITATMNGGVLRGRATISAPSTSDFNHLVKLTNNSTVELEVYGITFDHNNATRVSGTGDTLFLSGSGPITVDKCLVQNGPHDSNTDDNNPSADGVLLRMEGTGLKTIRNTTLLNPGYATFRRHSQRTIFDNVWSIVTVRKPGAYQRHGYGDSEAAGVNMLLWDWDGGGIIDTVSHKVNCNIDSSSDGPSWDEDVRWTKLLIDISTNHTNPDSDAFIKVNYVRRFTMKNCTQRHSNIDTIVSGTYTDQTNTASKEYVLNIGMCEQAVIEENRFDGCIKGIGNAATQCQSLVVRNNVVGENADIEYALANVANFHRVLWEDNRVKNLVGQTTSVRNAFDLTGSTRGQQYVFRGTNYLGTKWPTAIGQAGAIFRGVDLRTGCVACDDFIVEAASGTMATVAAFNEEERLAATARPSDPHTLHLERNIIAGGSLTGVGSGSGAYVATQQQPATLATASTNAFPDITGGPGARVVNDNPGNGYERQYVWNSSAWHGEMPTVAVAADPTTTEWPTSGQTGYHRNTSTGKLFLVRNVSGTIKKVELT